MAESRMDRAVWLYTKVKASHGKAKPLISAGVMSLAAQRLAKPNQLPKLIFQWEFDNRQVHGAAD